MAAEIGYMVPVFDNNNQGDENANLVTRDLLGVSFRSSSSEIDHPLELDLDLHVPVGWEKRLDLKSGKVYLQKCDTASQPNLPADTKPLHSTKYSTIKRPLNIMKETTLDLKLDSKTKTTNNNNSCSYESVCTLDKVRSALDRAKNEQLRRMFFPRSSMSPSTTSTSSKVTLELEHEDTEEDERTTSSISEQHEVLLTAAGCSNCLMYVMISPEDPKCPKCNLAVSFPVTKKPRADLDLNISI